MNGDTPRPATTQEGGLTVEQDQVIKRLETEASKILGTRRNSFVDSQTLCTSCQHASISRRASQNNREVFCHYFMKTQPEDISECSRHLAINELSLFQMVQMAHLIETRDTNQGYL